MTVPDFLKGKVPAWKQVYYKWRARKDIPFRKKFFIGYDLDGNTFWEFKNFNDPYRMRRIVDYRIPNLNYVDYKAPPQWIQWLRHVRPNPPSLQELYADKVRQAQLKGLADEADARWRSIPLKDKASDDIGGLPNGQPSSESAAQSKPTFTPPKRDPFSPPSSNDERLQNVKPIKPNRR